MARCDELDAAAKTATAACAKGKNMSTQYRLTLLGQTLKVCGLGTLAVDHGEANFFNLDEGIVASLERVHLQYIGPAGIRLAGFENTGKHDRHGVTQYRYQEWWLAYV